VLYVMKQMCVSLCLEAGVRLYISRSKYMVACVMKQVYCSIYHEAGIR